MAENNPIGNLLVEAGIISIKTLERALEAQKASGKLLGTVLGEMGVVTEAEILEALNKQCNLRAIPQQSWTGSAAGKKPLGNLLVEAGIISVKTLERALAAQKKTDKRLGTLLNEMGVVTEEEILEALARQSNTSVPRQKGQSGPEASGKNQIGNLLVNAGIISVTTLERALNSQKRTGKRLGSLLSEMGIVTENEVLEALSRQCQIKVIRNFAQQQFPKELLDLIPARLALEKLIFPLKENHGMLAIATLDPFDRATFDLLAEKTGMKIYLALATRNDIFAAIQKHYAIGRWATTGSKKILLLDSSPIITKFLLFPLQKEGYEVIVANDGVDGLKLAFTHHPDLILCDQGMHRMDGYTFMHALQAHHETTGIPVILMSSKVSLNEEHRALKAGFIDFIGKPAMPIRVIVCIKKALALHGNKQRAATSNALPAGLSTPPHLSRRR
jgi:CheY-like chemotaxis protein